MVFVHGSTGVTTMPENIEELVEVRIHLTIKIFPKTMFYKPDRSGLHINQVCCALENAELIPFGVNFDDNSFAGNSAVEQIVQCVHWREGLVVAGGQIPPPRGKQTCALP